MAITHDQIDEAFPYDSYRQITDDATQYDIIETVQDIFEQVLTTV